MSKVKCVCMGMVWFEWKWMKNWGEVRGFDMFSRLNIVIMGKVWLVLREKGV